MKFKKFKVGDLIHKGFVLFVAYDDVVRMGRMVEFEMACNKCSVYFVTDDEEYNADNLLWCPVEVEQ